MSSAKIDLSVGGIDSAAQQLKSLQKVIDDLEKSSGQKFNLYSSGDFGEFKKAADARLKILKQAKESSEKAFESSLKELEKLSPTDIEARIGKEYSTKFSNITSKYGRKRSELYESVDEGKVSEDERRIKDKELDDAEKRERLVLRREMEGRVNKAKSGDFSEFLGTEKAELDKTSKSLSDFEKSVKEASKAIKDFRTSGKTPAKLDDLGSRKLGILEELRLKESSQQKAVELASDENELSTKRKELSETRKQIAKIEGDAIDTRKQTAKGGGLFWSGGKNIATAAGYGMGGSIGAVTQFGLTAAEQSGGALEQAAKGASNANNVVGAVVKGGLGLFSGVAKAAAVTTAAALALTLPKGQELLDAQLGLTRLTGKKATNDYSDIGLNLAETNDAMKSVALSLGTNKDLAAKTREQLTLEFGSGLNQGELGSVLSFQRFEKEGATTAKTLEKMYALFNESGIIDVSQKDFTRLGTSIGSVANLNQMQAERFFNVNTAQSSAIVATLEKLGGTFKGEQGIQRFATLNEAIANPSSDYMRALMLEGIMTEKPNIGYYDAIKQMEQGAFGGNAEMLRKELLRRSGGDMQLAAMSLSSITGQKLEISEAMLKGSLDFTESEGVKEEYKDILKEIQGRAGARRTTQLLKQLDTYLQEKGANVDEGLNNLIDDVKSYLGDENKKDKDKPKTELPTGKNVYDYQSQNQLQQAGFEQLGKHIAKFGDYVSELVNGKKDEPMPTNNKVEEKPTRK